MWVQRDPKTGAVWQTYTQAQMKALIESPTPDITSVDKTDHRATFSFAVEYGGGTASFGWEADFEGH